MNVPAIPPAGAPREMRVQVFDADTGTMHDAGTVTPGPVIVDVIAQPGETIPEAMIRAQADAGGPIAWAPASDEAQPDRDGVPWCDLCAAWHPVDNHPGRACYVAPQPVEPEQEGELRPRPDRPVLVHSGDYALYLTPAGQYHVVYRRTAATHPATGLVTAITDAAQVHFRDLPQRAVEIIGAVLDRDTPLPPMLEAFMFTGKMPNPMALMGLIKQYAGADLGEVMAAEGVNGAAAVE